MEHSRVVPRDLFNDSKLLKCLGQLALNILDGKGLGVEVDESLLTNGTGFDIKLLEDGHLFVTNLAFSKSGVELLYKTVYNSKGAYPLLCQYEDQEIDVFKDDGSYTEEYVDFIESL